MIPGLKAFFNGDLKGKKIAMWGLAFKPHTDDIREAPALNNITSLLAEGASISVYDPEAMDNVKKIFGDKIEYCENQYAPLKNADALLVMTEWPVFRTPDYEHMTREMKNKAIFDGRNLFEPVQMEELGFHYESVGRKSVLITVND